MCIISALTIYIVSIECNGIPYFPVMRCPETIDSLITPWFTCFVLGSLINYQGICVVRSYETWGIQRNKKKIGHADMNFIFVQVHNLDCVWDHRSDLELKETWNGQGPCTV